MTSAELLFPDIDDPELARVWELSVPDGQETSAVTSLLEITAVEWVEPNYLRYDMAAPNDDCYEPPTSACSRAQWGPQKIEAPAAWDITQGSSAVDIAIVDTGVAFMHPDLLAKLRSQTDLSGTGFGDDCPHGTSVAGVAAAATHTDIGESPGIAGISWNSMIRSYKVSSPSGGGCPISTALAATAIRQAAEAGAKVINMSFGGQFESTAETEMINYAWQRGALLVGAAGNASEAFSIWPARTEVVISTAASDENDGRADWGTGGSNYGLGVDIAAPGYDIVTTVPFTSYARFHGTSLAAPHVAGVAALIASRGNFFPCEIRETILGVTRAYPLGGDPLLVEPINWQGGVGRLNAGEAVAWWPNGTPVMSQTNWPTVAVFHGEGSSTRYVMLNGGKWDLGPNGTYSDEQDQCIPQSVVDCIPTEYGFTDDPDHDGKANPCDNCDNVSNANQANADGDAPGDACDDCPSVENDNQGNADSDGLGNACDTDDDNDGVTDVSDNCDYWANPAQQLPVWPLHQPDGDCDGFPEDWEPMGGFAGEVYIGTNPYLHCAATAAPNDEPTPDAMPPDFNDDRVINGQDQGKFGGPFGPFNKLVVNGPYGPPGNQLPGQRFDFNADGIINGQDTGKFQHYFNETCV